MATYTHPVTGRARKYIPYAELDDEQRELVDSSDWRDRVDAAWERHGLEVLVDDSDWKVRESVADQGYGLEVLVDDPASWVRCGVAEQGFGLEKLVVDRNEYVREIACREAIDTASYGCFFDALEKMDSALMTERYGWGLGCEGDAWHGYFPGIADLFIGNKGWEGDVEVFCGFCVEDDVDEWVCEVVLAGKDWNVEDVKRFEAFDTSSPNAAFEKAMDKALWVRVRAVADMESCWEGEGFYEIRWSDGDQPWTESHTYFGDEGSLFEALCGAYWNSTETHLPFVCAVDAPEIEEERS